MSDITKCANSDCPLKKRCYRYTSESSDHQSFACFKYDDNINSCENFWDNSYKKALETKQRGLPIISEVIG
jgi:hypothetical protein